MNGTLRVLYTHVLRHDDKVSNYWEYDNRFCIEIEFDDRTIGTGVWYGMRMKLWPDMQPGDEQTVELLGAPEHIRIDFTLGKPSLKKRASDIFNRISDYVKIWRKSLKSLLKWVILNKTLFGR